MRPLLLLISVFGCSWARCQGAQSSTGTGVSRPLSNHPIRAPQHLQRSLLQVTAAAPGEGRIAILNDVPFHLEVLAGVVYCLHKQFKDRLDLYLYPNIYKFARIGLSRWIGIKHSTLRNSDKPPGATADVLIIISPEYNMRKNEQYIQELKPRVVIAFVHNGRSPALAALMALHPAVRLVTLAPHVAAFTQRRVQELGGAHVVDWLLASHPYEAPGGDCAVAAAAAAAAAAGATAATLQPGCLQGFCIQGFIDPTRRNYTALLSQIAARRAADPAFDFSTVTLDMVGKVGRHRFQVPPEFSNVVRMHIKVPYLDLYGIIHHSWALLPMLASEEYYESKFSSTVISSLTTGVPMLVSPRMLQMYTFLDPGLVYLVPEPGGELDAMLAITRAPVAEHWLKREKLAALREAMNARALSMFIGYMTP